MLTEGSTSPTPLVEQAQTEEQPILGSVRAQGHRRGRRRHLARSRRQRLAAVFVLLAAASAHSVVVWPGRMSSDTLTQISLVRAGTYTDWHASLLLVLWRPFWLLGVGPGWVTWASTVTFLFGLYALLRGVWPRALSVVVALAICAFPPVLGHIGYLGRDLWYTALFLVAAAAYFGWVLSMPW